MVPTPVAVLSMSWACGRSVSGVAGSNSVGGRGCLSVVLCVACCVGTGLWSGPTARAEDFYRVLCVWL